MRRAHPCFQCIVWHLDMTSMHSLLIESSLLVPLEALLQERHVSRAAARVGLTQSAMSRVLARLREALGDPLLVRSGRSMTLSPRAERLREPLRAALANLERVLAKDDAFDPATTRRSFRVATVDYGAAVAIVPLMSRITARSPNVDVAVEPLGADSLDELESGTLDFVLAPHRKASAGVVWTRLLTDRFVSVVRERHPKVRTTLDLDLFCALSHVVVVPERRATNAVDKLLADLGRERRVSLRVPSFLVALHAIADSDMILTTPESIARIFARKLDLRVLAPPVSLGPLSLSLAWHERHRADPSHLWLRKMIVEAVRAPSDAR
jgi:DNA-binding transcriptional LysR family regulator